MLGVPPRVVVTVCDGRWLSSWCCSGSGSLLVFRVACRGLVLSGVVCLLWLWLSRGGGWCARWCCGWGADCVRVVSWWWRFAWLLVCTAGGCDGPLKDVARLVMGEGIAADGPPVG